MNQGSPSRHAGRPAIRLTLMLETRAHAGHASLESQIMKRARKAKLAGATVFEGHAGYGASGHLHEGHLLSDDRPRAIVIVDEQGRIESFLEEIAPLLNGVTVSLAEVEVVEL